MTFADWEEQMGLFSRVPLLSVAVLDYSASVVSQREHHVIAPRDVEVVEGHPREVSTRLTGRWVLAVPSGTLPTPAVIDTLRRRLRRMRGVAVVAEDGEESVPLAGEPLMRLALTSPLVAVERALVRYEDFDVPIAADIVVRAAAIGRCRTSPGVIPIASPQNAAPEHSTTGHPAAVAGAWLDVFARVEEMGRRSERMRRPLLVVKNQIARELGRVIAREPSLRLPIFDEVRSRGFTAFSERTVNVECSHDLAVVYGFPPFLDTGGFVVSRRFRGNAEPYDVLTQDMSRRRPRDDRSLQLASRNLGRRMVVNTPLATGNWTQVEQFCQAGMAKITEREAQQGAYRTIYTRSMWIAPSVLGAWYKARNPETPWTAELSDPLAYRPNGELRPNPFPDNDILRDIRTAVEERRLPDWRGDRFFEAVEWMVYALADRIIFTNENQRDFMLSAFPDPVLASRARAVSEVQPHPVPEPELYEMADPAVELPADRINIGYFGNFYKVRGVDDLLAPLALLTPEERNRLRLTIFTATADEIAPSIADHPAADSVLVLPAQPYFEFLALTRRMDWLIVVDARTPDVFGRNPFLPSKLADYRGSGTPVWGIVDGDSVLSRSPLDARSLLRDPSTSAEVLRRIISQGNR